MATSPFTTSKLKALSVCENHDILLASGWLKVAFGELFVKNKTIFFLRTISYYFKEFKFV